MLVALLWALPRAVSGATALTGSTGLLFVPTANVTANECFSVGGVITDYQAFPARRCETFRGDRPSFYFAGYVSIGYIPRVEITLRGNGMPSTNGPAEQVGPFYTDGMLSMQVLLYRGAGWRPSVGVGLQDIYGFMLFNALYGVATWSVPLPERPDLTVTVGVAVDWYDTNRGTSDVDFEVNHVMEGPVVGLEYPALRWLATVMEYDSGSLNVGLRLRPVPWCTLDVAAARWGLDQLARGRLRGFAAHLHFNGRL